MPEKSKTYEKSAPRVYIRTFGCQMNLRDSEVVCGILKNQGYEIIDIAEEADVILLNTCSVRQHAEDKVWSEIGRIAGLRSKVKGQRLKGKPITGLVGCMAQNYKEEIFKRAPSVDFIAGPSDISKIPETINEIWNKGWSANLKSPADQHKICSVDNKVRPEDIYHSGFYREKNHAYVVISEGCSNYCSYCVVPYVRGRLHSRNYRDIMREIEEAVSKGISKITLLGQNVNAYQSVAHSPQPAVSFIELLRMVDQIEGLDEFNFTTSHPKDTSVDLFRAMAELKKLKKTLHLPVQSGSDRILKLMQRGYTRRDYLELAREYRRYVRNGSLTTDIIVGFPTEKKEDFLDSFNLVETVGFEAAFIFKYSVRPHTAAARFPDDVEKKDKESRHRAVLDLQRNISRQKLHKKIAIFISFLGISLFALRVSAAGAREVKALFLNGDYSNAISAGEELINQPAHNSSVDRDELYYILGLAYLKEADYIRAADMFEFVINQFADSPFAPEAKLGRADISYLKGEYSKASDLYRDLLKAASGTELLPGLYSRLSLSLSRLEKNAEAQEYADRLKKDYPHSFESIQGSNLYNSGSFYTVQVGAFSGQDNARGLKQKLIQDKYPAYLEEMHENDKLTYRVRVGKLKSRREAVELKEALSSQGYPAKIFP